MKIFIHLILGLMILMVGSDFTATDGNSALTLSLTGSGVIRFFPWVPVAIYALIVFFTRKASKRRIRNGGILAAFLLAIVCCFYPSWLFETYSKKIEIGSFVKGDEMFLPAEEIASFEKMFNTPTLQYSRTGGGPWLVVPRNKYSESMISFLRNHAPEGAQD